VFSYNETHLQQSWRSVSGTSSQLKVVPLFGSLQEDRQLSRHDTTHVYSWVHTPLQPLTFRTGLTVTWHCPHSGAPTSHSALGWCYFHWKHYHK